MTEVDAWIRTDTGEIAVKEDAMKKTWGDRFGISWIQSHQYGIPALVGEYNRIVGKELEAQPAYTSDTIQEKIENVFEAYEEVIKEELLESVKEKGDEA